MKPRKNVWRLGKRVQEGRGYFEIFLLLSFPQQGCYHGNRKPEFHEQAHARMWGVDARPDGGFVVAPAMSHFAEPFLSKGVMRLLFGDQSPVCLECLRGWLWLWKFCSPASHVCQRGKEKMDSTGRGEWPVFHSQQGTLLVSSLVRLHYQLNQSYWATQTRKGCKEVPPLTPVMNMDIPSEVNLETAYWVFFQWFHEKSISKDQSAILRHLGLLLWTKGNERERKQTRTLI